MILEAASGFEPENNGFAEHMNLHKYLTLLTVICQQMSMFCRKMQSIRNQFPHFAKSRDS